MKWKETIGDPVTRPGEYNLWGYRSTYGFGYYEFLQFCEDINAHGMFVCNAGMSCLFRNGDYADSVKVEKLIQEALDAVEFAIGDTTTHWGKERARMGPPAPFPRNMWRSEMRISVVVMPPIIIVFTGDQSQISTDRIGMCPDVQ